MSTQHRANTNPVRIHADHAAQKRLGDWTTARAFEVCARHAQVVIDLRSPQIPDGEIQLNLDLDHTTLTLLVADGALIDHSDLTWTGRGKAKQTYHDSAGTGRRIQLTGQIRHGEVRVHSGGIARLSAITSRAYLADARRTHAEGSTPTVHDPARGA